MSRSSCARVVSLVLALLVLGIVGGSAAHAATKAAPAKRTAPSWVFVVGEFLRIEAAKILRTVTQKNGGSLDPFGQPKPEETSGDSSDNGGSLDPFGRS